MSLDDMCLLPVSYNRYPDEKGTESLLEWQDSRRRIGYNRYPDEKGTESRFKVFSQPLAVRLQPLPR